MFKNTQAFSSFSVNNIAQAKQFYSQVLEIEVAESMGLLELHIAGGIPILIYPKENHIPATHTVLNFPVDNIEQAVDSLTQRGIQFEHYTAPPTDEKGIFRIEGIKQAWFKDPAGNILSVIESTM